MFNKMTRLPTILLLLPLFQLSLSKPGQKCTLIDAKGRKLLFEQGDIIRYYIDKEDRCSTWCKCLDQRNGLMLDCENRPLPNGYAPLDCIFGEQQCVHRNKKVGFGETMHIKNRGNCTCYNRTFICEQPEQMSHLESYKGILLLAGFSKTEALSVKSFLPDAETRRQVGYITDDPDYLYEDIGAKLQMAMLSSSNSDNADCRIMPLWQSHDGNNLLFRVERFHLTDKESAPSWTHGGPEKSCLPGLETLSKEFTNNGPRRFWLLLSTIKHLKVVDQLPQISGTSGKYSAANLNILLPLAIWFTRIF